MRSTASTFMVLSGTVPKGRPWTYMPRRKYDAGYNAGVRTAVMERHQTFEDALQSTISAGTIAGSLSETQGFLDGYRTAVCMHRF